MNTDYRGSICMPSLCTTEDLNFLARSVLGIYGANATVADCRTDDPKPITRLQAAAIAMIGAFLVLVAIGTALDWHLIKTASTKKVQYSVIEIARLSEWGTFIFIPNGFLSVVTFFFLSGFVLSYNSAAARKTNLKANSFLFFLDRILRRYVRLTFPMMFVMLVAFLLPLMGSGPADKETYEMMVQECATSWWRVLTHNNNFLQDRAMCLQHFWYVGADMQIFVIIALPLTMLMIRFPKISCAVGIVAVVAFSTLTCVQIHLWDQLYAFNFGTFDTVKLSEALSLIYFRPFTHVGSYVLGILCGYSAFVHKEAHIHWLVQNILWLVSFALWTFVIFVTYPWNNGTTPDDVTAALFGGFHRTLWALACFWPSYACATGRGGLLYKFLGWNLFVTLSRLTYCIYLVHGLVFYLRSMRVRTLIQMDEFFQFLLAAGVFTVSIFFAYLVHLMVEAPTLRFEKMILDRPTRLKSETNGRHRSEDKLEKSQL
ncbi:nose resistant to fluoxetine protein 6 isoform X2 [Ixodes scapularis]|uniref:nose resistant to fluoxetine protein 6 isoform X2 n=2 Tax=Ixodes scapularis TaxID=6945 RepID=UPI001A9D36E7|nr:nose resistant to fluoxetine protein 6 isoform X2 [Ixodes scapularis]